jgi:hypothetical protein
MSGLISYNSANVGRNGIKPTGKDFPKKAKNTTESIRGENMDLLPVNITECLRRKAGFVKSAGDPKHVKISLAR